MSQKKTYLHDSLVDYSPQVEQGQGQNLIPPPAKDPLWKLYLEKFKDPIIIVLLVVFFFSIMVSFYELSQGGSLSLLFEPVGVLVALLLATGVGFLFEVKADKEFDILNQVKDARPVKVLRRPTADSRPRLIEIKKSDVVVGDYVKLESGDEIPADGFLVETNSLRIDESNFTGELYANKSHNPDDFQDDATYPSNFVLRGSTVIEGNGIFKVSAVGTATEEGKGVEKEQEGSDVQTPLNQQLEQLGRIISYISFFMAALILVGRLVYFFWFDGNAANNGDILQIIEYALASVMIAVTLIVVAVPEGLPMSITVSLALSMRKMLKEKNLVRKLHACETMGATTVICTDKTGTLTQNQMTVMQQHFMAGTPRELMLNAFAVNSTAELVVGNDGHVQTLGNPTEGALLKYLHQAGVDYTTLRDRISILSQVPFSTERKYMETTVEWEDNGLKMRFLKGAPEILLGMCDTIGGGESGEAIIEELAGYQAKAMRTLGFACQNLTEDGPLTFIGIVGIADPIRDDVKDAIRLCRDGAGVRVIIVTGDTPGTANEIGRQIGLMSPDEKPQTLTGPAFAALSDDEAMAMLDHLKIISRARPADKARLVTLLQRKGEVVAVTGDGTNDAPALSKAQVGLSMGDGTSRAKEASDITIIDNSFSSINKAIMWGRSLYLNIRRFIVFQMTINICACFIVLIGAFIGMDSPLTVTQMLWVNLIMDTFAAMALSSLPADQRVLYDKPRNPRSHIIDHKMLKRIIGVGLLFFVFMTGLWQLLWHENITAVTDLMTWDSVSLYFTDFFSMTKGKVHMDSYEVGVFFSTFVLLQFWNLFNARYFRTDRSFLQDVWECLTGRATVSDTLGKGFLMIVLLILVGQIFIVNFAGEFFSVSPLSWKDWGMLLLLTSPILWVPDLVRFAMHLRKK